MKFNSVAAVARTLHIYLTMFAFLLIMFFSVTGILLDHEDWIAGATHTSETRGTIPAALLTGPDRLMIVEELRAKYGATGAVSTFDSDSSTLHVELKGPGRHTEADIDRRTGTAVVNVERRGFLARLDDLHRGKDTGVVWRIILDTSAVLLFAGALTGILMWFTLPKRRKWGLAALIGSSVILVAVYLWVVP